MLLEDFFNFNTEPCEHIRIKGSRIAIDHIIERFNLGVSAESMVTDYPTLEPVQVYAAITYYLSNREKMDAYLERGQARFQTTYEEYLKQPRPPVVERLLKLKAEKKLALASS